MTEIDLNLQSGERLSFYQMFREKSYHIEIPIIQRDYAQGRESKALVRETFLAALYQYLLENKPNRDLDFVYGSLINNGIKKGHIKFLPLDGQQRLTTLFLLHWYLANLADEQEDFKSVLSVKDGEQFISKFSYETRTSSREFCNELVRNEIDMKNLLASDDGKNNSLSKTIQDKGWYYLSWQNDPTIQSMLTMLDSIHAKFKDKPEFYVSLTNVESTIITFLFLNLKEFKLTDDLYIKMNARGRPLTSFENFKARFEKHIGQLPWEDGKNGILILDKGESNLSPKEYFSIKIDTAWANLFWQYRNTNSKDNAFDEEIMNFIRAVLTNEFASRASNTDKNSSLEYMIGTAVARKKKDYSDDISFHLLHELGALTKEAVINLINSFDVLSSGDISTLQYLDDDFYYNEDLIFKGTLTHNLTLPERIRFHAFLQYLIKNGNHTGGLFQWMRVIYNLTENAIIDGADEFARAIKATSVLINHSNNILEFLREKQSKSSFFTERQFQEEKIKAHLISRGERWQFAIEKAEKHPYFKGQIGFLIEFSGILIFFEGHNDCNWDEMSDAMYLKSFIDYSNKATSIFSILEKKGSESIDYLWERAVLTKGDYLIKATASRKNLLSTSKNMRDYSWKRLLRIQPESEKNTDWENARGYVKQVFDDAIFTTEDLTGSLSDICRNAPDDWRKYFIKNPEAIRYCEQGFIRFESEENIKLFKASQQNHLQRELRTYSLSLNELSVEVLFRPFANINHHAVQGGSEWSYAYLNEWTYDSEDYELNVHYYFKVEAPSKSFKIQFIKKSEPSGNKNYNSNIASILESCGFKWHAEDDSFINSFLQSAPNEKSVKEILLKLCNKLNDLI
ncbi:DUF262 domain-containing protein [Lunatibacter salilacus]|uniref:DUF262 domain-containing protein n=1 Tax=Lunatibacter salilacus TaxID=2483804 RepID=UPI00131D6085|nr:DUF262 domain-containing protein [Lunatibacter salilacus]